MDTTKQLRVYSVVQSIPRGKVASYKLVAKLAGISNPRHIGRYLHHNPDQLTIPCHRVVSVSGKVAANFAFGGDMAQMQLLRQEGVPFRDNGNVDMSCALWDGK